MSATDRHDLAYPEEKTRRIVARAALRRLGKLVSARQAEERQDALNARRLAIAFAAAFVVGAIVVSLRLAAYFGHVKIPL